MAHHEITVSVGGSHELGWAELAALIASLPGLGVVPLDKNPRPQVLVREARGGSDDLPIVSSDTAILILTEDASYNSLPETVAGLLFRDEPPAGPGIAIMFGYRLLSASR